MTKETKQHEETEEFKMLTEEEQWAKLSHVVNLAREIWK